MVSQTADYDALYLAGIQFFNRRDFFEAHEVWEELWGRTAGPDRRFYQALIQAAVALYHFGNGNLRGAIRLFQSSYDYMKAYEPACQGLDVLGFWQKMRQCFAEVLSTPEAQATARLDENQIPTITLDPPPAAWPEPERFLPTEENKT